MAPAAGTPAAGPAPKRTEEPVARAERDRAGKAGKPGKAGKSDSGLDEFADIEEILRRRGL